jgi:hypothetical protein
MQMQPAINCDLRGQKNFNEEGGSENGLFIVDFEKNSYMWATVFHLLMDIFCVYCKQFLY